MTRQASDLRTGDMLILSAGPRRVRYVQHGPGVIDGRPRLIGRDAVAVHFNDGVVVLPANLVVRVSESSTPGTPTHKTIRMVERKDGNGYRRVPEKEFERMRPSVKLEGVDGDEGENTVTYWYTRDVKEY